MKNKFIITITDIHGSRQYTLHQIIKKLLLWIVVLVVIGLALAILLSKFLMEDMKELHHTTKTLKKEKIELEAKNRELREKKKQLEQFMQQLLLMQQRLVKQKETLEHTIQEQEDKLLSLNEKLKEVEDILGIKEENNISHASLAKRIEQLKVESNKFLATIQTLSDKEKKLLHRTIPIGYPVSFRRISARFGYRIHPIYHKKMFHFGIDLSTPVGRTVYAPADGVVYFAGRQNGYGNFLIISHPFGFSTAYGHLSKILVKKGMFVKKGQAIAKTGNTGRSTGPHLHYEIRYLSYWLDPYKFMTWNKKNDFRSMKRIGKVDWDGLLKVLRKRYLLMQKIQ